MTIPRSLSGLQYEFPVLAAGITVAPLFPAQPPLHWVWKFWAPSVTRKTKGCVLVEEVPPPPLVIRLFMLENAFSKCVPPDPRFELLPVSSSVARLAAA